LRLSDLQTKKIINIMDGRNIGTIIDANVLENGTIESFVIESGRGLFSLNKETDTKILWQEITKIGEDVILVKKSAKWQEKKY